MKKVTTLTKIKEEISLNQEHGVKFPYEGLLETNFKLVNPKFESINSYAKEMIWYLNKLGWTVIGA